MFIGDDVILLAIREILAGKTVVAPELSSVLARFVQGDDGELHEDKMANPYH